MHSKLSENIILVDPNDRKIGEIEKMTAHRYAMLHRAFSVVIFRERRGRTEVLLQQRSKKKYHGGGLWANACCSHPHAGEKIIYSAQQRLNDEMGIKVKLKEIGKFHYVAKMDKEMTENEIDHVFIGSFNGDKIPFNPNEVAASQWVSVSDLRKDLTLHPKKYAPWLKQALEMALKNKAKLS